MRHGKYLTGLICLTLIAVCLSACVKHDDYATGEATESSQIQTTETGDMDNPEVDHSTASENDDRDRISVKENDTGYKTSDKISETEKQINELPEVGISNNPSAVNAHNTSEKEQESPAGKAEMSTQGTDENLDKKENDDQDSGDDDNRKTDQNNGDTGEKKDEETEDNTETGDVIRDENGVIMLPEVP